MNEHDSDSPFVVPQTQQKGPSLTALVTLVALLVVTATIIFFITGTRNKVNWEPQKIAIENASFSLKDAGELVIDFDFNNVKQKAIDATVSLGLFKGVVFEGAPIYQATKELASVLPGTTHQTITYSIPKDISGTFKAVLNAESADNGSLGAQILGDVSLEGTGTWVSVDPKSCHVLHVGDPRQYWILERASFEPGTELALTCVAETDAGLTLTPTLSFYKKNINGVMVAEGNGSKVNISPNTRFVIPFTLPADSAKGVYVARITLANDDHEISNPILVYYTIGNPKQ